MKSFGLEVAGALKNLVSGDAYSRWFSSAYLKEVNETEALLGVVSDMHQVWIETNYLPEVQAALASVSSLPRKVRVVVCEAIQDQLADAATASSRPSCCVSSDHNGLSSDADPPRSSSVFQ